MGHRSEQKRPQEAPHPRRPPHLIPTAVILAILGGLLLFMWFTVLRHDARNLVGQPLPDVAYIDLSGAEHRLAEHTRGPLLLVVVRSHCDPCEAFLQDLLNRTRGSAATDHILALFLDRPEAESMNAVRLKDYPFPQGFVRVLREAAPLQVIVVPTVFLAVDGRIQAVEYGLPERLSTVVASFVGRFQ